MSDKKEMRPASKPRNLQPQRLLPGQGAEPRTGSSEKQVGLRPELAAGSRVSLQNVTLSALSLAFRFCSQLRVGHAVLAINGVDVNGKYTADGKEVLEYLGNPANYPVSIRFGRPRLTSNEKLMLASMFHSLFAIGSQLSPEQGSSGIEMLETDTFKLHCFQTLTGIKFVVLADPRQAGIDSLLRKIYEIYSDFALKNPFYSLEMPIRCELFDQNLKLALEVAEKAGTFGPGS
ncbi:trafficking protein particle complex subunit 4 isoform X1 [Bos indicus]|uniref:Trafficking protein particle complex subunit n=1 Tax=Bos indicus TaxID=9915 RepID=A0ABM4THV2_BOSIN